jgi:hypothetical protein
MECARKHTAMRKDTGHTNESILNDLHRALTAILYPNQKNVFVPVELPRRFKKGAKRLKKLIKKIKWLKSEEALKHFYDLLKEYGYIGKETDWLDFANHFLEGGEWRSEIRWTGDIYELVYLFDVLTSDDVQYIRSPQYQHKQLHNHFINRYWGELNQRSMSTDLLTLKGDKTDLNQNAVEKLEKMDHMIDKLLAIKN